MWRHFLLLSLLFLLISSQAAFFSGEGAESKNARARRAERSPRSALRQPKSMLAAMDKNTTIVPAEMAHNCIKHTGGSCFTQSCDSWRGSTECTHGKCFCSKDTCAGSDGKCHSQPYKTLIKKLKIRNVRWPDYYMYVGSMSGDMYVSESTDSSSEFILQQFPGKEDFVLTSAKWPDHVVNVREMDDCAADAAATVFSQVSQTSENVPSHYYVDCSKEGCFIRHQQKSHDDGCFSYTPQSEALEAPFSGSHLPVTTAALKLEEGPKGDIMISSVDYPGQYFYVGPTSSSVLTEKGDPGTGGYWKFDPPLSLKLPTYSR